MTRPDHLQLFVTFLERWQETQHISVENLSRLRKGRGELTHKRFGQPLENTWFTNGTVVWAMWANVRGLQAVSLSNCEVSLPFFRQASTKPKKEKRGRSKNVLDWEKL